MIKANLITHNKNIIYNYKLKLMSENCTHDFSSTHFLCVCVWRILTYETSVFNDYSLLLYQNTN